MLGRDMLQRNINFGPMKIYQETTEVLIVSSNSDEQVDSLVAAGELAGLRVSVVSGTESALERYLATAPDVVAIDLRTKTAEGDDLCRAIRAVCHSEFTVILGIVKIASTGFDPSSVYSHLSCGFNRLLLENQSMQACFTELVSVEKCEVQSQLKLRVLWSLTGALDYCHDAIEVQTVNQDRCDILYMNLAYEKMTGYERSELQSDQRSVSVQNIDCLKQDLHEAILRNLSKGKLWESTCWAKRKNGETYLQNITVLPVVSPDGRTTHRVSLKRDITMLLQEASRLSEVQKSVDTKGKDLDQTLSNGTIPVRRNSLGLTKIEAPITKVINMLSVIQEESSSPALEKAIDILRSAELYSPFNAENTDNCGTVPENELVEGLMNSTRRRASGDSGNRGQTPHRDLHTIPIPGHFLAGLNIQLPPEIAVSLADIRRWDFDIFKLEEVCGKRPLYYVGMELLTQFNTCEILDIPETTLRSWLQLIEANYHSSNSYHNSTHAADVMHATACFLLIDQVQSCLEPLEKVSTLLAAVVHDLDHPGVTNSYLCNKGDPLALLYNDTAVLENHHAAMAFKLTLSSDTVNIFKNLSSENFRTVRQNILDMVLSTEMKQHYEHLSKFVNLISTRPSNDDDAGSYSTQPEFKRLVKRIVIKSADICNPCKPFRISRIWAERIADEYFAQMEKEKSENLPVLMSMFDRGTCNLGKSQISFIDYFVKDLFTAFDGFAKLSEPLFHLNENYELWKAESVRQEAVSSMQA